MDQCWIKFDGKKNEKPWSNDHRIVEVKHRYHQTIGKLNEKKFNWSINRWQSGLVEQFDGQPLTQKPDDQMRI